MKRRAVPAGLVWVASMVVACTASDKAKPGAPPETQAVCPATIDETIGAPCLVPGLVCGPSYACGTAQVSLFCVCRAGSFQCTDGAGNQVAAGRNPTCTGTTLADSCPLTEASAQLAACKVAGSLCTYASDCPGRIDQCLCFPGTTLGGGFGLRFECEPAVCHGAPPIAFDSGGGYGPDSGPDAAQDSAPDSPLDSASGDASDALAGDASHD